MLSVPLMAAGSRLDQWLVSQLPDVSRVRVQQLIEQKKILINGNVPKPSMKLRGGEEIVITGAVELPPLRAFAEDIPLDVVYEDESIAVINKPAGMSVHAGSGKGEAGNRGTMVNALLHRFNRLSEIGGELRPGIVHRLDKETSGLVLVAKSDLAHRKLAEQFARREVKKTYIALVHGWPKMTKGTIRAAISRDPVRRARMTTRQGSRSKPGREAITHWQVTRQIEGAYGKFSLLEVKIKRDARTRSGCICRRSATRLPVTRFMARPGQKVTEVQRQRLHLWRGTFFTLPRYNSSIQLVTGRFRSSSLYRLS
jgi:23S rRNA pseudouridine1911/1915/1917 synthase